jgi:hypothetical protein
MQRLLSFYGNVGNVGSKPFDSTFGSPLFWLLALNEVCQKL